MKRPDKDLFVDSVVLGSIVYKDINIKEIKSRVRKHMYKYFPRKFTYIKINT